MMKEGIAARAFTASSAMSPYPASFDGSPWLFTFALASLMAIGIFGMITAAWMARDIWRDRTFDHPLSLPFLFRLMIMIASSTAFMRSLPEVVYMTVYGEAGISPEWIGRVMGFKRLADVIALPTVVTWMAILVMIYPFVMIELRSQRARSLLVVDPAGIWYRLARPALVMLFVILIAALMAFAKGAVRH